jgi:hypothetical protein
VHKLSFKLTTDQGEEGSKIHNGMVCSAPSSGLAQVAVELYTHIIFRELLQVFVTKSLLSSSLFFYMTHPTLSLETVKIFF